MAGQLLVDQIECAVLPACRGCEQPVQVVFAEMPGIWDGNPIVVLTHV